MALFRHSRRAVGRAGCGRRWWLGCAARRRPCTGRPSGTARSSSTSSAVSCRCSVSASRSTAPSACPPTSRRSHAARPPAVSCTHSQVTLAQCLFQTSFFGGGVNFSQFSTHVGKPSATGQPTRPTQPFILSGSIKLVSWNQMCAAVYR